MITYLSVRKSQIKTLTEEIRKIHEVLGDLSTKKNFVSLFGNDACDKTSLSDQHDEINKLIKEKEKSAMDKLSEVEKAANGIREEMQNERLERLRCENAIKPEQVDINKTLETVKTVIEAWKEQNVMIEEYKRQIQSLEIKNKRLEDEIREYKQRTQSHGFKR